MFDSTQFQQKSIKNSGKISRKSPNIWKLNVTLENGSKKTSKQKTF